MAVPQYADMRAHTQYDLSMSERKSRITVTIDPGLAAYAERLVETGKADSVSAVVNSALEAERRRSQRAAALWKEAAEQSDPEKVDRMLAHVEAQAAQLPERYTRR